MQKDIFSLPLEKLFKFDRKKERWLIQSRKKDGEENQVDIVEEFGLIWKVVDASIAGNKPTLPMLNNEVWQKCETCNTRMPE